MTVDMACVLQAKLPRQVCAQPNLPCLAQLYRLLDNDTLQHGMQYCHGSTGAHIFRNFHAKFCSFFASALIRRVDQLPRAMPLALIQILCMSRLCTRACTVSSGSLDYMYLNLHVDHQRRCRLVLKEKVGIRSARLDNAALSKSGIENMAARLLKKTGEAIKHSPGALRRALSGSRDSYQMALEEAKDPFKVGLSFYVTYIGYEEMEVVSSADSKTVSAVDATVNRIVHATKTKPAKRLILVVNDKNISFTNPKDSLNRVRVPLYAVAYAGSHPIHDRVFVFLESRDATKSTCHVLLCENVKMAKTLVRVAAKAFQNAFLDWQAQQKREKQAGGGSHDAERTVSSADSIPNNMVLARSAPAPQQSSALEEDEELATGESKAATTDKTGDASATGGEEKVESLARHRSFYRRSCVIKNPEVLFTGELEVKPEEFDLDEAKEFVQTLQNDTV